MSAEKNSLNSIEDKDVLIPVRNSMRLYSQRETDFWTMRDIIRAHGEAGYTFAIKELSQQGELTMKGGVYQQQWLLNDAEKYLTSETVSCIIDMSSADGWGAIDEHSAVLLAKKWDIAERPTREKIERLLNDIEYIDSVRHIVKKYVSHNVILKHPEVLNLQNKKIHVITQEFGGREKLETLITSLGLAFLLYEDKAQSTSIIELLKRCVTIQEYAPLIEHGLKRAYIPIVVEIAKKFQRTVGYTAER